MGRVVVGVSLVWSRDGADTVVDTGVDEGK